MKLILSLALQAAVLPSSSTVAPSQGAAPDNGAVVYRGDAGQLEVAPPHFEDPDIRIDGRLDEALWDQAAELTGFTQYEPVEGVAPVDETRVFVFYSDDALYVGVRASDSQPEEMRARLGERDRAMMTDDWIRIMLDTYDDRRQAYLFYLTPRGIQADGLWLEGGERRGGFGMPVDFNPDYIWQSEALIDAGGWSAELRIPYISMRFRTAPVQSWGFNVARETRRNGYKTSWAPLTQNQTSTLAQIGRLTNLQGLRPRRLVELNPVVTARRIGELGESGFQHDRITPEFGFNGRVAITPNMAFDATINPDFSQIEADADQITANERFALSVPEKRPFFLDGTEIFNTPQRLVYTRRIVDPAAGTKLTGKLGSFSVGYLGALDQSATGEHEIVTLARVRRDVAAGSTVGALLTDRTDPGDGVFGRAASLDARLLFGGRYSFSGQVARSWARDSSETRTGNLYYASIERSGQTFGWEVQLEDVAPDFDARSGFIRRIGDGRAFARASLTFRRAPGSFLESWGSGLRVERFHRSGDLTGPALESEFELEPSLQFRGANSLRFILRRGYYAPQAIDYDDYTVPDATGAPVPMAAPATLNALHAIAIMPRVRPTSWLQLAGRFYLREVPIYAEGSRGLELLLSPDVQLWPTDGLSIAFDYSRSRLRRQSDDRIVVTQDIPRVKMQYQFSRSLLARIVAQYNLYSREPLRDPATGQIIHIGGVASTTSEEGSFGGQFLISYEPSPGTLFYIGWAQQMRGLRTLRLDELERVSDGIFIKLSYLHRL